MAYLLKNKETMDANLIILQEEKKKKSERCGTQESTCKETEGIEGEPESLGSLAKD